MVNDLTTTQVTRQTPDVSFSRPELKPGTTETSTANGRNLPDGGKTTPLVEPVAALNEEPKKLLEATRSINEFVQFVQRDLSFNLDEESGRVVIKVIARDSGDIIRQIPTEEALAIAQYISEVHENAMDKKMIPTGLLISENV